MRTVLAIAIASIVAISFAHASERFSGFLTFGCGDLYLTSRGVSQTWFVNLTTDQEREVFRQASIARDPRHPWLTLHTVLEATLRPRSRRGYFGNHPQQLDVQRVIVARYPEVGESIAAAIGPARRFKGYVLLGEEMAGFEPLERNDEFWWIVPGKTGWEVIDAPFRQAPASSNELQINSALVEIVGRVGPPGMYGHLGVYLREIAVDEFKFVRRTELAEISGTGAKHLNLSADINRCKPQPQ